MKQWLWYTRYITCITIVSNIPCITHNSSYAMLFINILVTIALVHFQWHSVAKTSISWSNLFPFFLPVWCSKFPLNFSNLGLLKCLFFQGKIQVLWFSQTFDLLKALSFHDVWVNEIHLFLECAIHLIYQTVPWIGIYSKTRS